MTTNHWSRIEQIIHDSISAGRFVIIDMFDHEDGINFWSNDDGWTFDLTAATFFDHNEVGQVPLPINGAWLPVSRAQHYV